VQFGPLLEILLPDGDFFDGAHEYAAARPPFRIPAELDAVGTARLQECARQVFTALGGRGLMRVDFFVRPGEEPVINEVNTMPGMTAASQYPQMWAAAGYAYDQVLDVLVTTARIAAATDPSPTGGRPIPRPAAARDPRHGLGGLEDAATVPAGDRARM
jgi:D-alanine-D-alanine ligase